MEEGDQDHPPAEVSSETGFKIPQVSPGQPRAEIDISVSKLLGFETFANFLRVSVSVSENLVSEKKSRYRFRKIWYRKKSLGIGQNFGIIIQCQKVPEVTS